MTTTAGTPDETARLLAAADRAASAWGLVPTTTAVISGGLINATFAVLDERDGQPPRRIVLQRLHPVFAPEVNLDIERITAHLAAAGLETPRLVRTEDGAPWLEIEGAVWRALTHVPGVTFSRMPGAAHAEAAGELVGRFHRALDSLRHDYASVRVGVHDTAAHLARLRSLIAGWRSPAAADTVGDAALLAEARDLGREILDASAALPALGELPLRHAHGDLKVSNVLFDVPAAQAQADAGPPPGPASGAVARCLIDLDTLGRQTIAYELGDALRSWCNPHGEDVTGPTFDRAIYEAAMRGYEAGARGLLTAAERAAVLPGAQTVCVELAARFCADVFENSYFGWDRARYPSRRAHNLVRARGQLALSRAVAAARAG